MYRFGVLGPLLVERDGVKLAVQGPRSRVLLALLLAAHGPISRDRLIEELWGTEPPASAVSALHVHLSKLRGAIGDALVLDGGYALDRERMELDADQFEALVERARQRWARISGVDGVHGHAAGGATAGELLRQALGLFRGEPLVDLPWEGRLGEWQRQLTQERLEAIILRIEIDLAAGVAGALIGELERLVTENPFEERLAGQLMLALYRSGRQTDALAAYQSMRTRLADEVGLEPGAELRELQLAILNQSPSLSPALRQESANPPDAGTARTPRAAEETGPERRPSPAEAVRGRLPPRSRPVIGREREIAGLEALLLDPDVTLISLTGAGGIGKTTIALEAARRVGGRFEDGVAFVALGAIRDEQWAIPELARVLGIDLPAGDPPLPTIASALRAQQMLLVIDNLEQVIGVASSLAQLAIDCPQLTMLVTSRTPLRVDAERICRIGTLDVPEPGGLDAVEDVQQSPAGALFLELARAADPGFTLDAETASAVIELCRYLGGLPLALELAAARMGVLGPEEILTRLTRVAQELGPGRRDAPERHQTLRATIDWSLDLLTGGQRALFARLGLFVAGFTIDAVEAVSGDLDVSVVDGLGALLDHGLIHRVSARRGRRLGMLEPILDRARELLQEDPGLESARVACADHFATLAERGGAGLTSSEQLDWLDRLDADQANLRNMLHTAGSAAEVEAGLRIAGALSRYWSIRGFSAEIAEWLPAALAWPPGEPAVRARALYSLSGKASNVGDWQGAIDALEECTQIASALGDDGLLGRAEANLSWYLRKRGRDDEAQLHRARAMEILAAATDPRLRAGMLTDLTQHTSASAEEDRAMTEQALALYESVGDRIAVPALSAELGFLLTVSGEHVAARAHLERALAGPNVWGPTLEGVVRANLGLLALLDGAFAEASDHLSQSFVTMMRSGDRPNARETLYGLAGIAVQEGNPDRARRLVAAARTLDDAPLTAGELVVCERFLSDLAPAPLLAVTAADVDALVQEIARQASAGVLPA